MKSNLLLLSIGGAAMLWGCSDDKSASPASPLGEKTYTASSLELYYNGQPMPAKTAVIAQNGSKGVLKLFSEFDLSQLSGMGLSGKVPGPGAIPGTPEITLDFDMNSTDGYWEFAGDGNSDFCSFNYAGYADDKILKLYLNDVSLKSGGVQPEVWKPAPITKGADGSYTSLPFYIDWTYEPIPGVDLNFSPLLSALATLPVIPVYNNTAYMSVSQALEQVVRTVAFKKDGNILVSYISTVGGAASLAQTPANVYQYVIDSPSTVRVFVNPMSLIGMLLVTTSGGTPASDIKLTTSGLFPADNATTPGTSNETVKSETATKIMQAALKVALENLATGYQFNFTAGTDTLDIFIDTATVLKLTQEILLPVLKDDATLKEIVAYLEADKTLAQFLPDIQKALELLPQAIERTTTFRIGFAFVKS